MWNRLPEKIIPSLFFAAAVIALVFWLGMNSGPAAKSSALSDGPGPAATSGQPPYCHGYYYSIPTGGDVFLGEGCLNISDAVSSGQIISWYSGGSHPGAGTPDAVRTVRDAGNFFADPDAFHGYDGAWYAGTTDRVAFVMRDATSESEPVRLHPEPSSPSSPGTGVFDPGFLNIINATDHSEYLRAWVILKDPQTGGPGTVVSGLPGRQAGNFGAAQGHVPNATESVATLVRDRGYIVEYTCRTIPAIGIRAPASFLRELAAQPVVQRIGMPKTSPRVIREMERRGPDETIDAGIYLTVPQGTAPEPETSRTELQMREWYAKNRILYQVHTKPVLDLLKKANITIDYPGPYPMAALYGNVPVRILEELNGRSDVELIELNIPARLV